MRLAVLLRFGPPAGTGPAATWQSPGSPAERVRLPAAAPRTRCPPRPAGDVDAPAVRGHQRRHDRQAEAAAGARAGGAGAAGVGAVEALEDAVGHLGRHARARRRGPPAATSPPSRRRTTPTAVPDGVCATAFVTRLPTTWRSRASSPRTGQRRSRASSRQRVRGAGSTPASCTTSDATATRSTGARSQRPLRVEPRQQQQVLDEQAHARRLVLDAPQHPGQHRRVLRGALPEQLGEAPDRGERRAQLVAGVPDELPHALLRRPGVGLRALLRGVGALEAVDHGVEGRGQAADLGARVGGRDADAQVAGRDRLGGRLDGDERAQAAPHRGPRQHAAPGQREQADRGVDDQELGGGVLHAVQRDADDELLAVARVAAGEHPPAAVAGDVADLGRPGRQVGGVGDVRTADRGEPGRGAGGQLAAGGVPQRGDRDVAARPAPGTAAAVGPARSLAGAGDELGVDAVDEVAAAARRCRPPPSPARRPRRRRAAAGPAGCAAAAASPRLARST